MEKRQDMKQYEMFELKLAGAEPEGSHVEVDVNAEFVNGEKKVCVKGFYAGNGEYVVRFYPAEAGVYKYQVTGAVEASGEVECEKAEEGKHGIVGADGTHFRYADGTWYHPFGTTVYAMVHQEEERIDQTIHTLEKAPFNKIRICVFPKHYDYNHNDPEYYAFEKKEDAWDVHHPCFEFWNRLERRIRQLEELGIQCDLILFHSYDNWGFAELSREQALVYLDYLTRRLSAFPNIWWSMANEYDLMRYQMADWENFAHYIHENDPYGHLLSNHHMVKPWDFANEDTTHICIQTGKVENVRTEINKYKKPMMIDECGYEGNIPMNWGNLSAFEMVNRFWKVCMQGGYCTHGETFKNDEDVLWWSKGGELHGESPARIGFLKEIIESLPGALEDSIQTMSVAQIDAIKKNPPEEVANSPFFKMMVNLSAEEIAGFASDQGMYECHCEEEVYMKYFERHCTCLGNLNLPESGLYDVEVIDVWEMTRTKAAERVNGNVEVKLPGKEGIAILARRVAEA